MSYYHGGLKNGGVDWSYFNRYEHIDEKYLPVRGEGETMATQIVTAVAKLVYKWYNDGDVFDNTKHLSGWCNDLSSYANWLDKYTGVSHILERVYDCRTDSDYENLLKDMTDYLESDEEYLSIMNKREKIGSIYKCDGRFEFCDEWEDEEEYEEEYEEDEDDYDDEEEYDCEDEE